MNSQIFYGTLWHRRELPRVHEFRYPLITFGIDLSELDALDRWAPLFGYRHQALFGIRDADYLSHLGGSIQEKLHQVISSQLALPPPAKTILVTMPRFAGYVFNPVSFYVSSYTDGALHSIVVEVNNTFGETHLYPLKPQTIGEHLPARFTAAKRFFVSPFFDSQGEYQFLLSNCSKELAVELHLFRDGARVFSGSLRATGVPLTKRALAGVLLKSPLSIWMAIPRIQWQALWLLWRAKVPVFRKPDPTDPNTIRSEQGIVHRVRLWILQCLRRENA